MCVTPRLHGPPFNSGYFLQCTDSSLTPQQAAAHSLAHPKHSLGRLNSLALSSLKQKTVKRRISYTHLHPRGWGVRPSALRSNTYTQTIILRGGERGHQRCTQAPTNKPYLTLTCILGVGVGPSALHSGTNKQTISYAHLHPAG